MNTKLLILLCSVTGSLMAGDGAARAGKPLESAPSSDADTKTHVAARADVSGTLASGAAEAFNASLKAFNSKNPRTIARSWINWRMCPPGCTWMGKNCDHCKNSCLELANKLYACPHMVQLACAAYVQNHARFYHESDGRRLTECYPAGPGLLLIATPQPVLGALNDAMPQLPKDLIDMVGKYLATHPYVQIVFTDSAPFPHDQPWTADGDRRAKAMEHLVITRAQCRYNLETGVIRIAQYLPVLQ